MGKDKSAKRNKTSRKIQDRPAKGNRAATVKGGIVVTKATDVSSTKLLEEPGIYYF